MDEKVQKVEEYTVAVAITCSLLAANFARVKQAEGFQHLIVQIRHFLLPSKGCAAANGVQCWHNTLHVLSKLEDTCTRVKIK